MMVWLIISTVAFVTGTATGAIGAFRRGHKKGVQKGMVLERRAEAMRRLSARAETEWNFLRKATGGPEDGGLLIYARSPDGHEYTRRSDDMDVRDPRERAKLGYDDAWYDVEAAAKASDALQNELTIRFNAWQILVSTGARGKEIAGE